jgi:hypothetical protein
MTKAANHSARNLLCSTQCVLCMRLTLCLLCPPPPLSTHRSACPLGLPLKGTTTVLFVADPGKFQTC